jgi:type I restriction enzyme R subunit
LILSYQLALLSGAYRTDQYINKISSTAKALLKKQNIQVIALQVSLLNDLQTEPFWRAITINGLDKVRVSLRDLIKYLDKDKQVNVITTFEDDLKVEGIRDHDLLPGYGNLQSYKDRVESYIRTHKDHLVIHKLKTNKPITQTDINTLEGLLFDGKTLGTQQDYLDNYGDKPLGEFIRGIVGLDVSAAQAAFADFIQTGMLRADQMTFINSIISYLTRNGMIDKGMLYDPPFTHIHDQGIAGVFDDAGAGKVLQLIDGINQNALVFKEVA